MRCGLGFAPAALNPHRFCVANLTPTRTANLGGGASSGRGRTCNAALQRRVELQEGDVQQPQCERQEAEFQGTLLKTLLNFETY